MYIMFITSFLTCDPFRRNVGFYISIIIMILNPPKLRLQGTPPPPSVGDLTLKVLLWWYPIVPTCK